MQYGGARRIPRQLLIMNLQDALSAIKKYKYHFIFHRPHGVDGEKDGSELIALAAFFPPMHVTICVPGRCVGVAIAAGSNVAQSAMNLLGPVRN